MYNRLLKTNVSLMSEINLSRYAHIFMIKLIETHNLIT